MKWPMVVWFLLTGLCGNWAIAHRNDTDEEGNFRFQWRMIIWFLMLCAACPVWLICELFF